MATKTIDNFSAVTVAATTDTFLVTQAAVTKKETLAQLDTLLSATTKALTNKTLTSPVINTGVSGTAIDTDGTLTANSDTKIASQKAVKTYADLRMLKTGSNLAVGSDADGDMYYRAASVLARLAKGAADFKLFMNAGATAPEWASGLNYIAISRDLAAVSGDVAYTGMGFKPTALICLANIAAAKAAFLLPKTTAKVLILCCLSPSMSTMPLVISRPVFDRKAMDAKISMLIVTVLTATRLPKRNGAATQALTRRFPGNPARFPIVV